MLPAAYRLRRRPDFTEAVRRGRRAGRQRLVVHVDVPDAVADAAPARVGFVVGRTVGGAVVRNRVRRQLRHLMATRLSTLPPAARIVVRVLPPAAGSSSRDLATDLDAALSRARGAAAPNRTASTEAGS